MPYSEGDLAHLLRDVRRPYMSGGNRDALYEHRRAIRHRRIKPWLPEDFVIKDDSIYFRDPLPGFVINRLKQRLGANSVDITVRTAGDAGPKLKESGNKLEDALRGIWDYLDPIGQHDGAVRDYQSGDGIGFYALECLPHFLPPDKGEMDDTEYDDLVADRRKEWPLPVRMYAPDPRSLYWIDRPEARIPLMVEMLNVPLATCKDNWTENGFRLAWDAQANDGKGGVVKDPIVMGTLPPAPTAAEYGRMVRIVKLSDDTHIYHCMYNVTAEAGNVGDNPFSDDKDTIPQLTLLATYPNHFKRVPYFPAPARRTTDPDPAFRYEPLAMEVIDMTDYTNALGTLQMATAYLEVLKPIHFEPNEPPISDEGNKPSHLKDIYKPGILKAWGKFSAMPTQNTGMFKDVIEAMNERQATFNLSLMGMLQNGSLGKSTPAWSLMQINEEQVGFINDALVARATAIKELLESCMFVCRTRYNDGPLYVRATGPNRKDEALGEERSLMEMHAADFEIPHHLEVSIEGMTQSQRAANTEYGRELKTEGSISNETYLTDYVGIKDLGQEKARQRQERLEKPTEEAGILLGLQRASNAVYEANGNNPIFLPLIQAAGLPLPSSVVAEQQAMAQAQNSQVKDVPTSPKMPGQGMDDKIPTPPGPRNGAQPETMATGRS